MADEIQYNVIKKTDGSYAFKYVGHVKEEDNVVGPSVSACQAARICTEHNDSVFGCKHGIERRADPSGLGDHHGRQVC